MKTKKAVTSIAATILLVTIMVAPVAAVNIDDISFCHVFHSRTAAWHGPNGDSGRNYVWNNRSTRCRRSRRRVMEWMR